MRSEEGADGSNDDEVELGTIVRLDHAKSWLAAGIETFAEIAAKPERTLPLRQLIKLNSGRIERWKAENGRFEHAVAMLAFDAGLIVDPQHIEAAFIKLVVDPKMKSGKLSKWAKILRRMASSDDALTPFEVCYAGLNGTFRLPSDRRDRPASYDGQPDDEREFINDFLKGAVKRPKKKLRPHAKWVRENSRIRHR